MPRGQWRNSIMKRDRTIKRADLDPDACPQCGNVNITGDSVDIEGQGARQGVRCEDCEALWHDVYQLVQGREKGTI